MKKVLLGLFFAMFAMQVNAATLSWNEGESTAGMVIDLDNSDVLITSHLGWDADSAFDGAEQVYRLTFDVEGGDKMIGATAIEFFNSDLGIETVTMDGVAGSFTYSALGGDVSQWVLSPAMLLSTGSHYIDLFITSAKLGAQVSAKVNAVPLPAAVWLFGSALMGLFGASRRKSSAMAA